MKLPWIWLLSSFALGANPSSSLIANIPARSAVSLNGAWHAIVDPYENGVGSGFFRDDKPRTRSDRVEYSFDLAPVLNVPGDWNTQREALMFYEGRCGTGESSAITSVRTRECSSISAPRITGPPFI